MNVFCIRKVAAGLGALALAATSLGQVELNRVDDFEDGTEMSWAGASPINIATGGPAGAGDNYLQAVSTGSGAGGNMAIHNTLRWVGNFPATGVKAVSVDVKNFSNQNLTLRLVFFGLLGSRWTSTNAAAVSLPANADWRRITFLIRESDFTRVLGSESWNAVMTDVQRMMIRHDASTPSSGGTPVVATVGFDNFVGYNSITALPSGFSVITGQQLAGNLASLLSNDSNRLLVINDENDAAAEVHFTGTVPTGTYASARLRMETISVRDDQSVFYDLFNYQANDFDNIGFSISTLTDSIVDSDVTSNVARYIGPAGAMKARVTFIPSQDLDSGDGWSSGVDFVNFIVNL